MRVGLERVFQHLRVGKRKREVGLGQSERRLQLGQLWFELIDARCLGA